MNPKIRSRAAFALAILAVASGLELLRWASLPPPKPVGKPVYAVGPAAWADGLAGGRLYAVRGPAFLGLVPGRRVFSRPEDADAWLQAQGYSAEKWKVYLVDADFAEDTRAHGAVLRMNKGVRVLMAVHSKPALP